MPIRRRARVLAYHVQFASDESAASLGTRVRPSRPKAVLSVWPGCFLQPGRNVGGYVQGCQLQDCVQSSIVSYSWVQLHYRILVMRELCAVSPRQELSHCSGFDLVTNPASPQGVMEVKNAHQDTIQSKLLCTVSHKAGTKTEGGEKSTITILHVGRIRNTSLNSGSRYLRSRHLL